MPKNNIIIGALSHIVSYKGGSVMSAQTGRQWIDISVPLRNAMVHWPGDSSITVRRVRDMERGDVANLTTVSMGAHSGTHMDAPLHFVRQGEGIDRLPLETVVGRARVIEIGDTESIKPGELERHHIRRGERILFKTRNSSHVWQTDSFVEDFVSVSGEAAAYLVKRGVRLIGVDYLSVGGYRQDGGDVHRTLLSAGVWLIEGLNLSAVTAGNYQLICLPLRLAGAEGAPARAILRQLPSGRR